MTAVNLQRRSLFRRAARLTRPMPWAVEDFTDRCQRCDDCVRSCEEAVLVVGDGGFPGVDFSRGGCSFCGACVPVCRYGALDSRLSPPWRLQAVVGDQCLSTQGITCRSCADPCGQRALGFQLQPAGRAQPTIDAALCNGCGACVAVCPTHSIRIQASASAA